MKINNELAYGIEMEIGESKLAVARRKKEAELLTPIVAETIFIGKVKDLRRLQDEMH